MSSDTSRALLLADLPGSTGETGVTRPDAEIRLLTGADALAYRDIRLDGLRRNPEAFASTFGDERDRPLEWFAERIAQSHIFGAILAQRLVGVVGLREHADAKQRHKAMIWGMYVRREARHYGIGERLVEAAVAYASGRVEQLQLAVVTANEAARRLYAKAGFIEYGHQVNALKHSGRYYDDILMVKFLALELPATAAEP
jgi:ribosomal protein S18 acetylase RimI-like enzyme